MNVIFLGPMRIPIPSEKGAVEDIIWQLAKRLPEERVWIFNPILPEHNKLRSTIAISRLLPWAFGKENLVIHSHVPYPSLFLEANRVQCRRHLVTLHYPPWITGSVTKKNLLLNVLKVLDKRGVGITVPSLFIRNWLISKGVRCEYIPNGVDLDTFNPRKRDPDIRSRLLGGAEFLFVNLGRMDATKNQLTLLQAFKKVLEKNSRAKLVLMGPKSGLFDSGGVSSYASAVASYISENGLDNNVEWIGEVRSKAEVAGILASCDAYVHPSKIEAAPLAIIEAMASGLPIIAFDLPWYRGYLENGRNALLCPPSFKALSESMLQLFIEGKTFNHKLIQCEVSIKFSWETIVNQYLELYKL